jgi:hypothetical protein
MLRGHSISIMNRILILVTAIALPLFACDSGGGEYVKKTEEFATQACACKDAACATKVSQEQADWLSKNAQLAAKLDAKDAEKVGAATTKMAECVTKVATGG